MSLFAYEEQGDKKYLVYEKGTEDTLDVITLEMLSNNRIDGVVSLNYIQIDDSFYMKYDITGKRSLQEYLQGIVNKQKILSVLESIADAVDIAEDYMINFSSYVLNTKYMYIELDTQKISMVVLPVIRSEVMIDIFLRELLMSIRYDQAEDCSYVAALINLFGSPDSFSIHTFKEQIVRFKKAEVSVKNSQERKRLTVKETEIKTTETENKVEVPVSGSGYSYSQPYSQPQVQSYPSLQKKQLHQSENELTISEEDRKKIVKDLKREQNLEILFSSEDDKTLKKEKKSFFFKKEKPDKPDKPGKESFWGKLMGGKKGTPEKDFDLESALGKIAIPGKNMQNYKQQNVGSKDEESYVLHEESKEIGIVVPAQNVEMNRKLIDIQDFGETVFIGENDDEETFIIGEEREDVKPEYILYRHSTQECFHICNEVTRIGRNPNVTEICISGNKGIGRIHAMLYLRGGQVFIEDNNSKNKTYVDGVQLEPGELPRKLVDGSKIRLGDEELEFRIKE